jgi:hypothetical protein
MLFFIAVASRGKGQFQPAAATSGLGQGLKIASLNIFVK